MKFLHLVLLLALLAASCGKRERPPLASHRQHISLNLRTEPATMDPRKGGDIVSSSMHFLFFEGLVRLNADNTITPAQAKSFEVSADGAVYTFHLRGTAWSDGTPVTAYDFEKSWKDILDPAFPSMNAHLLYPIKNAEKAKCGKASLSEVGIEARDPLTLVVTLEKPTPYFLDLISFCVFSPVSQANDAAHADWAQNAGEHFVGNGPFVLKEWKHNNEIVAVRNPKYWDKQKVRPDTIHFSMVDNEMTALQMFEKGQIDMIGDPLSPIPLDALPTLKGKGKVAHHPVAGTILISFNVDRPPFNNAKVRKAFAYAMDREAIVKNLTQLGEVAALGAVPPILKNNRVRAFFKDNDAAQAKMLLEEGMRELGITREAFNDVVYYYAGTEAYNKIAVAVQEQWQKALGVTISLQALDRKILLDKQAKRDYVIAQNIWMAQYNDQMSILERFKSKSNVKNYSNWENAAYAKLLEDSFYENGAKRAALLEKAEAIFLDEMPVCPIYHLSAAYMAQTYLYNADMTPVGDLVFEMLNIRNMNKK